MRIFVEMQPTYTFLTKPPFAIGLAYVVAGLVLMTVICKSRAYRGWELALLAGVTLLGNFAFRSLQDWLLVMLAVGGPRFKELFVDAVQHDWRRWWVRCLLRVDALAKRLLYSPLFRWQLAWPAAAVAGLLILSLVPPVSRAMPLQDSPEWPVAALDHIEKQGLKGRFFAPPDFGAYLTWRLGERVQVYADTRGFFFPPQVLEDSIYIPQMGPEWRARLGRVLDDCRTDYFLLERQLSRGTLWRALAPHIDRPLHVDEAVVLLRADQVRAALHHYDLSFRAGDTNAKR